jgi:hypothetical protein
MSTRRDFIKTGGALVIGFTVGKEALGQAQGGAGARGAAPANQPDARQIDTWLAIHADETATLYIGFAELGQGTTTALPQIAAEELDMDVDRIQTVRLETNRTPNQGGTYSQRIHRARRPPGSNCCSRSATGVAGDGIGTTGCSRRSVVHFKGRGDSDR